MKLFLSVLFFLVCTSVTSQTTFAPLPSIPASITKIGRFGFRYTFVSNTLVQPSIDNEPNHRLKVENIGSSSKTDVRVHYAGLNADGTVPALGGGGFAVFPNGGNVNLRKNDTTVVQGWSSGWRECSCIGDGVNNKKVQFIFAYDSTFYGPDGLPDGTVTLLDTIIQSVILVQRSQTQLQQLGVVQTTPSQIIGGTFIVPGYIKSTTTLSSLNLATNGVSWNLNNIPSSNYVSQVDSVGNRYIKFSVTVDPRNDYRVEANFTSTNASLFIPPTTIVVPSNISATGLLATVLPYGKAAFSIDSVKTYETETGFWRTVFSSGDSCITVFPGQENWFGNTTTERNANRAKSKIIKFKVDNANYSTKLWEYALPTESWGGAVSKDGRVVVYMINQRGVESGLENNTAIDWVGVLDGTTGVKKWGLRGDQSRQEGLEVGVSSRGDYVALGTSGSGRVSLYRNNGTTGTLLWSNPVDFTGGSINIGQVRKLIFSDDDTYLYAGCGDMYLRKYKVSDGTLIWKAYIGGWPFVNGLSISNGLITTGTKSKDRTVIRDSDGAVIYFAETMGFDASTDPAYSGPAFGFGPLVTSSTSNRVIANVGSFAVKHSILNGSFALVADRSVDVYSRYGGVPLASKRTYIGEGSGEQSQSGWSISTGDRLVVTARDLTTGVFPRKSVAFYRVNRTINRYPTMDSIGSKSMNPGDTVRVKITYRDFNDYATANTQLSITATPDTSGLKTIIRGDSLIIYNTVGFSGSGKINVSVSETSTTEKFSVSELVSVRVICNTPDIPTATKSSYTYCKGETATLLTASSAVSILWYTTQTGGTGATTAPTPSTTAAGTLFYYAASASNGCESSTRLRFTILVNDLPVAPSVSSISICNGVSSSALTATAGAGNTLRWYGTNATGGNSSTTAPTPSSTTSGSTDYYVSQINTATGCESIRSKLTVTIIALPLAPAVSALTLCTGAAAVSLSGNAVAISGNTLTWYGTNATGGSSSNTAPTPPTSVAGSTDYYVSQVNNSAGCESARSKITVTVNTTPPKPTITKDTANFLSSSSTINNSWFKNGVLISDTTQRFKPTTPGSYTVKVTINGCSSPVSDPIVYVVTAITTFTNGQFIKLYPNPVRDQLKIEFNLNGLTQLHVLIYDISGKLLIDKNKLSSGSLLDLSIYPHGIFIIKTYNRNGKLLSSEKIIKQ